MSAERYRDIFKELVKAYNKGTLKKKFNEITRDEDSELIKKYIFSALGIDYIENASFEDIEKAMDMKKMKGKLVIKVEKCGMRCLGKDELTSCQRECPFGAIEYDMEKGTTIINDNCTDCGRCVDACEYGGIIDKIEYMPLVKYLQGDKDVYAIVAPAYIGQFGDEITPGKLRSAIKALGFKDMIEVALFADILTIKEAIEFDRFVHKEDDFMITSCCCPMWVAMIKRLYSEMVKHVPPSVSPMVACGRTIKKIYEGSKVVFIGPCVAKKAEAKETDIKDAVDFVLTFKELREIFDALQIKVADYPEDKGEYASRGGRTYAYTGGVSKAVADTVSKLSPGRDIKVTAVQGNGVRDCKEILQMLREGRINANFIEGMGCVGGCVGGPKAILDEGAGRERVHEYGNSTDMITPLDNPYLYSVLKSININEIEELVESDKKDIYEREF